MRPATSPRGVSPVRRATGNTLLHPIAPAFCTSLLTSHPPPPQATPPGETRETSQGETLPNARICPKALYLYVENDYTIWACLWYVEVVTPDLHKCTPLGGHRLQETGDALLLGGDELPRAGDGLLLGGDEKR
jgi:hypothetical protein